jgi:hypothetical protein
MVGVLTTIGKQMPDSLKPRQRSAANHKIKRLGIYNQSHSSYDDKQVPKSLGKLAADTSSVVSSDNGDTEKIQPTQKG